NMSSPTAPPSPPWVPVDISYIPPAVKFESPDTEEKVKKEEINVGEIEQAPNAQEQLANVLLRPTVSMLERDDLPPEILRNRDFQYDLSSAIVANLSDSLVEEWTEEGVQLAELGLQDGPMFYYIR
ncbi:hypothetical protein PFISCL1PPCAC_27883, partial [Pristionchus fissidentatus]